MKITKENAVEQGLEIIINSWTWERLTLDEMDKFLSFVASRNIKGTVAQRWDHIFNLFSAFLYGCGYDGPRWRDPDPDNTPKF